MPNPASSSSITVPSRWWAAFTVYPCPPAMRRVVLELARLRWSPHVEDDEVVATAAQVAEPAACSRRTAHLMLRVASTLEPVRNGSKTWQGRGLLHRRPLEGTSLFAYRLTMPHAWWWASERQAAAALELAQLATADPPTLGRGAAIAAAETLWAFRDPDAPPPVLRQARDPRWPRWVRTMEGLLARGYSLGDLQEAMREARGDPFYAHRLQREDADTLFALHFPGFLQRSRARDPAPPPPPPPLVFAVGDQVRVRVDSGQPITGEVLEVLEDGRLRIQVPRRKPPHELRTITRSPTFVLPVHGPP